MTTALIGDQLRARLRLPWPAPRETKPAASPYFGNYFCLIPGTPMAFVAVSKNAVTFLKRVALLAHLGHWPTGFRETHEQFGYTAESPLLVPVSLMGAHERAHGQLTKFAVWRDPLGRMESTYRLFCQRGEERENFKMAGLQPDPGVDRFLEYAEREWAKPDPAWQDEHFRSQCDYYCGHDVDDIVAIDAVAGYLRRHGVPSWRSAPIAPPRSSPIRSSRLRRWLGSGSTTPPTTRSQ